MSANERREQLIEVARRLFSRSGYEGTSVEEIAASAGVSKPIVYEHFGGKEGLYAVVVDREVRTVQSRITAALATPGVGSRQLIELATIAMLGYIEDNPDGFRIIARDAPLASGEAFSTILSDAATQVEELLVEAFDRHGFDPATTPLYAQGLVGIVALAGQWWLDDQSFTKEEVATHLVNLAWNGMSGIDKVPTLRLHSAPSVRPARAAITEQFPAVVDE